MVGSGSGRSGSGGAGWCGGHLGQRVDNLPDEELSLPAQPQPEARPAAQPQPQGLWWWSQWAATDVCTCVQLWSGVVTVTDGATGEATGVVSDWCCQRQGYFY